jgi:hypothetical protein
MTDSYKFDASVPAFVPKTPVVATPEQPNEQHPPMQPRGSKNAGKSKRNNNHRNQQRSSNSNNTNQQQQQSRRRSSQNSHSNNNGKWNLEDYIDEAELVQRNRKGHISLTHMFDQPSSSYDFRNASSRRGGYNGGGNGGSRRPPSSGGSHSNSHSSNLYSISSHHPPADKTTYINTTCRFVLDPRDSEVYAPLLVDSDIPVPMERVMRILARPSACPICLEDIPKAPRMLRCGHIMCLPCLIRYVESITGSTSLTPPSATAASLHNGISMGYNPSNQQLHQQYHKPPIVECPLCSDEIKVNHVKPVSFLLFDERFELPKEGQDVVLNLMFRPQGDANSMPLSAVSNNGFGHLPIPKRAFTEVPVIEDSNIASRYSRLVKGSREYVFKELDRELSELEGQRDEELALYQDQALAKYHNQAISRVRKLRFEADEIFKEEEAQTLSLLSLGPSRGPGEVEVVAEHFDDNTAYYFYQTAFDSDIKYFLAPLDVKLLRTEYGGAFSTMPSSLVVKVDNIVFGNYINDELKKRLKYMGNIPAGTQVAFIECRWNATNMSKPTLDQYAKELSKRKRLKADKKKRENTQARRIQQQEKSELRENLLRESGIDIGGDVGFPEGTAAAEEEYKRSMREAPSLPPVQNPVLMTAGDGSKSGDTAAAVALTGSTKPKLTKTVWGTRVPDVRDDPYLLHDDDYGIYDLSQGAQRSLEWVNLSALNNTGNNVSGSSNRKGRKKVLLTSTSGGRR